VLIQELGHDRQCWQDCLPEYGAHKTICNRFARLLRRSCDRNDLPQPELRHLAQRAGDEDRFRSMSTRINEPVTCSSESHRQAVVAPKYFPTYDDGRRAEHSEYLRFPCCLSIGLVSLVTLGKR
jgi:hypothetical protein